MYKTLLNGYINNSKNGPGQYLAITNVSDEEIVPKPGDKLFLNKTPDQVIHSNPKVPHFTKSIKVAEDYGKPKQDELAKMDALTDAVNDSIPF